jgi:hypothetical protein
MIIDPNRIGMTFVKIFAIELAAGIIILALLILL